MPIRRMPRLPNDAERPSEADGDATPERPPAQLVDVGGGLLLSEDAATATIKRRVEGHADRWETCTQFDPGHRVHQSQFHVWRGEGRRPADAGITTATILGIWGAGSYMVTQHSATGLLGKSRELELGAPGDARGPARAGVPEPPPPPAPPPPPPPPPAPGTLPPAFEGMSAGQLFMALQFGRAEAQAAHDRELAKAQAAHDRELSISRERHRQDMADNDQRNRAMLEFQANTMRQTLEIRRAANPAPAELGARFDAFEARLLDRLDAEDEDEDPRDDDSIAGQVERIAPIALGVVQAVVPFLRPQTQQGGAAPPPLVVSNPEPARSARPIPPRRSRVIEMAAEDAPVPAVVEDDDQDDDDDGPESSDGYVPAP